MLGLAIKSKLNTIRVLTKKLGETNTVNKSLSERDSKALTTHLQKKFEFLSGLDSTKWKSWPRKSSDILKSLEDKKNTNFKRRENQKRKVMEKQARKALEEGNILVLVEDVEVPLGAVSVLSKGLGFIPTPKPNDMESRLDMRLTINRILQASSRINYRNTLYNGSSTPSSTASSPSRTALFPQKLSQKHYSLSSLDEPVNDIVNSMQEELDQTIC